MSELDADRRGHWERLLDSTALEVTARALALEPDDRIGRRIGPYVVESWIGSGGMGDVYRARDVHLDREVALKVLPDAFAVSPAWVSRFQEEARLLALVGHPNIAAIYGFEPTGNAIAMELVEGDTLSDRLARGALPIDEALPVARQMAEALEAAHDHGVVHHDLKPSNVGLRPDGTVKLLDFGLAAVDPPGSSPTAGPTFGTPAYLSPERAAGRVADRRADIWAFGAVLYEMLSGRKALGDVAGACRDGAGPAAAEPIAWDALPSATPVAVRRLLERCLDRDPRSRLRDAGEARVVLETIRLAPTGDGGRGARQFRPLWLAATTGVAAVAGIAVLASWPAGRRQPAPAPTRFTYTLKEGQPLAAPTSHHVIAISPDGRRLVYAGSDRLFARALDELQASPIAGTDLPGGTITEPAFSPDGASIAFWSAADQTVKTIPSGGGSPTTIARAVNPWGLSWASDGLYVGAGPGGILHVPIGGTPTVVARVAADEQAHGPQRLPGGALLFTIARGNGLDRWDAARVVVQSPDGARRTLLEHATDARYVPTGHLVYAASDGIHAVAFDLRRLTIAGRPLATLAGVRRSSGRATGAAQLAVSDTGTLAYVPGAVRRAGSAYAELGAYARIVVDRSGRIDPMPIPPGPYREIRVARDGRLAIASDDGADAAVYLFDPAHPGPLQRLTTGGRDRAPIWSADARHVAFQSGRDGSAAIYWQPADGSRAAERLTSPGAGEVHWPEAWLPDGSGFLFSVGGRDGYTLWTFTLRDRRAVPFGGVRSSLPVNAAVAPDGHWVAYTTDAAQAGAPAIVVEPIPPTGAHYALVVDRPRDAPINSPHRPLWARDGRTLFYIPRIGQFERVPVTTRPHFAFGTAVAVPRGFLPGPPDARRSHDLGVDGGVVGLITTEPTMADEFDRRTIQVILDWLPRPHD